LDLKYSMQLEFDQSSLATRSRQWLPVFVCDRH